jgi:hypothetical protein
MINFDLILHNDKNLYLLLSHFHSFILTEYECKTRAAMLLKLIYFYYISCTDVSIAFVGIFMHK